METASFTRKVVYLFCCIGFSTNTLSQGIPENAYVSGNNWFCNSGFERSGNSCRALNVPENAYVSGNNWFCNSGFERSGNSCRALNVPENAYVSGNNWFCNSGYRRQASGCVELTQTELEKAELLREIQVIQQAGRSNSISGHSFTLRDIARRCEVYKYSDNYGEIECRGTEYRVVERRCEAYFPDERNGIMECSGDLRSISGQCSVNLYSSNYGDLSC